MAIYFLLAAEVGLVKIGYSKDPKRRINELSSIIAAKSRLIKVIEGSRQDEQIVHETLAEFRKKGEWFEWNEDVLSYVNSLTDLEIVNESGSAWEKMIAIEPGLKDLYNEILLVNPRDKKWCSHWPEFCANSVWYRIFKPRLCELVGWEARIDNRYMRSSEAYDLAYDFLYNLLPDCTHDGFWC